MIRKILLGSLCALSLTFPALTTPAFADAANLLGAFGNWSAYSTGTGNSMTCYAMSKPRAMQPRNTKRAVTYLMVSDWPSRKVKAEPEIVPGYEYKESAPVSLASGDDCIGVFHGGEHSHRGDAFMVTHCNAKQGTFFQKHFTSVASKKTTLPSALGCFVWRKAAHGKRPDACQAHAER